MGGRRCECDGGEGTNALMTPIQQTRLDETSASKTALLMTTLTMPSFCDAANFPVLVGTLCLTALSLSLLLFDDDDDDDDDDGGRRTLAPVPILPRGGGGSGYACTGRDDSRVTTGYFIPKRKTFPLAPPRTPLSSQRRRLCSCSTKNMTTWSGCRSHRATTTTIRSLRTGTA